jgi:uncharacterized RDD family membrane protein YckC
MEIKYANLPSRIKAAVIDSIIMIGFMFLCSEILSNFESVPNYVRILLFVFIFFLYDPIFTSIYGGTIGHSKAGITVRRENNPEKKINFLSAIVRFAFKFLLGWISFLTMGGNTKRKAIHDYIVNSIVIEEE